MNDNKALERAAAIAAALRCCGSSPKVDRCKDECMFYRGGYMGKCIPAMTEAAAALIEQLTAEPPNDPLTLEELQKRTKPVWCDTPGYSWIPDGGYYCLCKKGMITTPSKQTFQAEECLKNGWILLERKPDGGGE